MLQREWLDDVSIESPDLLRGPIYDRGGWQLSRRTRAALEYAMAIVSALASSYLILRLGL